MERVEREGRTKLIYLSDCNDTTQFIECEIIFVLFYSSYYLNKILFLELQFKIINFFLLFFDGKLKRNFIHFSKQKIIIILIIKQNKRK